MANPQHSKSAKSWLSLTALVWQHRLVVPGLLLVTLVLGVLAWHFNIITDHTNNRRNTLSKASIEVLQALPATIEVTAFCSNTPFKGRYFRKSILSLVQRYQHVHPDIHLQFVDPSISPTLAREQQIKKEGEMIIRYRGQQTRMYLPYTEEAFTNVLLQLQHGERAPLLFAAGLGETALESSTGNGGSQLAQAIRSAGLQVISSTTFALATSADKKLPTLVLAGATRPYSQAQVQAIQTHISKGGNLVWLVDNIQSQGLQTLADTLGLTLSPGVVVDPANRQFEIPLHALSTQRYSGQGPTQEFSLRTFFDQAHAIVRHRQPEDPWRVMPLVAAAERGWASTAYRVDQPEKLPAFNAQTDTQGPATIALALEKKQASGELQRVVVVGSNSFFTNAQQQRGGNLAFSMQTLRWVVNNQPSITLPVAPLRDSVVLLPSQQTWLMVLFNGFQFGLPAILTFAGWLRWRRKHQH
ncbi:MAG: DUF4350 domain-containing protein [Methylophilus sp.]|uniref:DUF4350 domain-containing protein n=1 Tax=Methylophilus sp. TaxID=29541 RepID=UPI003F9FA61D